MDEENIPEQRKSPVEALIFDLDGVITQTRKTHKKAWKELFDLFFEKYHSDQASMSEKDYLLYIDGKPRYEGVNSFLDSREISLPFGTPEDAPGYETICALGNTKNRIFNEILDRDGVDIYDESVKKLKEWKRKGYKTAIVSSSKNCQNILKVTGLEEFFDVRVDGLVSEELGLKGKPDPDIFSEAARKLNARPERSVVFEDAVSGVEAGQRGFFGLVVGVNRFDNKEGLLQNGADICIENFDQFDLEDQGLMQEFFLPQGTPVFPENQKLFDLLSKRKPVFFLDYDGTLTPIVSRPEDAVLSGTMKETLRKLASTFTVAIVTGRDKEDVENLVGLNELIYAGSHGYIISGPGGLSMEHPDSKKIIPKLDKIEAELKEILKNETQGTQLDRKRYAIGIHYRNAPPNDEKVVNELAEEMVKKYPGHKIGKGKKIVEIKPDLDWHKGKAVDWILKALDVDVQDKNIPLYIGDDITDEDAFKSLKDKGLGILVGGHGKETTARYSLKNVFQVRVFFEKLIAFYTKT